MLNNIIVRETLDYQEWKGARDGNVRGLRLSKVIHGHALSSSSTAHAASGLRGSTDSTGDDSAKSDDGEDGAIDGAHDAQVMMVMAMMLPNSLTQARRKVRYRTGTSKRQVLLVNSTSLVLARRLASQLGWLELAGKMLLWAPISRDTNAIPDSPTCPNPAVAEVVGQECADINVLFTGVMAMLMMM